MCCSTSVADKWGRIACAVVIAAALTSCTKAELIGRGLKSLASEATSLQSPPLPVLTLDSTTITVTEGSPAIFTVTLSQPSDQTVTVDYATVNGTAKSGRDYTAATGTLIFAPGTTTQTLTVTTLANSLYSDPLTYQVQLSHPANATVGSPGAGSITNTDPPPTISFFNATNYEGCGAIFVARQSAVTLKDTVITWSTADGTALAGTNYTAVSTTTTLPAGALEVGLSVPLLDDSVTAADKTFTATVSSVVGATISGGATVTGTVKDKTATIASFTKLNRTPAGTLTVMNTWMSPDHCTIAYNATQDSSSTYELYTASPFGTSQLKISHPFPSGAAAMYKYLSFTPNGQRLIYIAEQETAGVWELYSVKPDGTSWTKLNPTPDAGSKGVSYNYAISGDGTKIVYKLDQAGGGGSKFELYVANIDGTQDRKVNDPFSTGGCVNGTPSFSVDSSLIAYFGNLISNTTNDLFVDAADGSGSNIKLTPSFPSGAAGVTRFSFTPDGQKIVFLADIDTPQSLELYSINLDGSGLTKMSGAIPATSYIQDYQLSHDLQKVSYIIYDNGQPFNHFSIYASHVDGTSAALLHGPSFNLWFDNGGFTPDDTRVVYDAWDSDFFVTSNNLSGTNELINGNYAGWGNLSAHIDKILSDGRIVYSSETYSGGDVNSEFIVSATGTSPTRLTTVAAAYAPTPYISPDETHLIIDYNQASNLPCGTVNLNGTGYTALSPAGKACVIKGVDWTHKIAVFNGDIAGAGSSNLYVKSIP